MTALPLTLSQIQQRLAASRGRDYWRSLEELAETPGFQEFLHREFPRQASEWQPQMSRRRFLQLMGASLALAGLSACASPPAEKIVPYVTAPEEGGADASLFFATAMPLGGYGMGLLVQSHANRPTKVEGNPDHPASLGATDAFAQASILTLYDPDRAKGVTRQGESSDWPSLLAALRAGVAALPAGGAGLRILTETVTSPTLFAQLQQIAGAFPDAIWHQYEPVNRDAVYAGAALAFGRPLETLYRFDQAQVILSLDGDFLENAPGRVRYARDFSAGRRADSAESVPRNPSTSSGHRRLYAVESTPTLTGAAADHRLPLRAGEIGQVAQALARQIGLDVPPGPENPHIPARWVEAVAADLQAHPGSGLVVVGDHQPPEVHALAHALNARLGNARQTVVYTEPVAANPEAQDASLAGLVAAMAAGEVELLLIVGGNPAFASPADVDFAGGLAQVGMSVHWSLYADETAALCDWHVAESHFLETWGDVRAFDGTVTIQQPLIAPLYDSHDIHELLDALLHDEPASAHELVKNHWQTTHGDDDFEDFWRTSLHDGVVAGSALPPLTLDVQLDLAGLPLLSAPGPGLEINFRADPTLWDGRFANNGWLQELPKPLTKLTWENAVLISPLAAEGLGLANGDWVEIAYAGRTLEGPVWLMPGHCPDAITLHLGHGHSHGGRVAIGAGFNAYALRTADALWFGSGASLRKLRSGYTLASTQHHHSMEGRALVREGTVAGYAENPHFVAEMGGHAEEISLYPRVEYATAWGMAVDLNACIGCNACVVACQAENNIPIVGKEEVAKGREMHWIRVDSYFQGDLTNPAALHQPVMCMHCEHAPCEVVCPVAATLHDADGLNVMVYNRCVGTRYCSNNCPYKVRRFNFLQYTDLESESLALQRNPQVTVRSRGVMEKCTYCVQRISAARISAKLEGRELADGDVVTACQSVCPTRAIVFGDQNDPDSRVAQLKASPLNYGLLTELNTAPRTTYLARLRNPNPALE
ncbi:MAG: TAT-variant-translocated molybdopterin oxidoreductase [Chloroflexi bacterium]|nr:TAT-variant-translocated molybdopterin oxidoreductase [Chloroflexota bacterium]